MKQNILRTYITLDMLPDRSYRKTDMLPLAIRKRLLACGFAYRDKIQENFAEGYDTKHAFISRTVSTKGSFEGELTKVSHCRSIHFTE